MPEQESKNAEVLIVGAGPSGLMMACQLAIQGIHFRIIDKREHPSTYSGALIIHARSVEIFDQMGIADKFIQEAILANDLSVYFNGIKTVKISLKNIGYGLTKFPNLYLIEQSKTEQLLIDFLSRKGFSVERKAELKSFSQNDAGVTSVLKTADGKEERISTDYLIASDGGHSLVREQLNIPFIGKIHPVSLFIIDCKAELDLPQDEICFSFSDDSTSGFFPLKNGRKRIDGVIPKELEGNHHVTFEDIEKKFAERLRMKIKLYDPDWFSVSHSHQRYAESYQINRCFLVGDAAHTFSPVSAQGMNTGLQDAYNLAWKLAFVIQGKAKSALLDSYAAERKNIAKKIAGSTGRIYNFVTSRNGITKFFRLYVLPHLMKIILPLIEKQRSIRQYCFSAVSEIGVNYKKSLLSQNASLGNFKENSPKAGERLPYLVFTFFEKEINIQDKINVTGFTLLIFTKGSPPVELLRIAEKYKGVLSFEIISFSEGTKYLFDRFDIKNTGCYLIRPDMYIAFRSNIEDAEYFESYLRKYLIEK